MRHTGGCAFGAILIRSKLACSASAKALSGLITPNCSPFAPITLTSLSLISSLISSSFFVLMIKHLRFLSKIKARTYSPRQQTRYRKKYRLNIDPSALLQSKVSCAPLHCFMNYTTYRRQCQYRQANFSHKNRILKEFFSVYMAFFFRLYFFEKFANNQGSII